ncbi:PREDICTED: alpha-mannosidase 2x-like, partial [Priapulus caudatus]|uniref:Alpha-mannosidase 2x-like n=1 Tax=Priapulus caudatus TaxID=37621 RepID=A0ABM1F6I5_PRICU
GAEVLFSVAQAHARRETGAGAAFPARDLMTKMVRSRRALGLFQHHDAITGTGKDFVMADYGMRMFHAIADVKAVTNRCAHYLLTGHNASSRYDPTATAFFDLVGSIHARAWRGGTCLLYGIAQALCSRVSSDTSLFRSSALE